MRERSASSADAGAGAGPPFEFRDVLIVMLSAIGDAVHVLPVANALKRARPDVRLTWAIQPVPHILVRDHPAIDEFVIFHRRRGLKGLGEFWSTGRALRARPHDLAIGLQVYFKAGVLTAAARAPVKLGFDRARARDLNWLFTTHRIPPHEPQHVQDQYFEFLHYLGVDPEPVEWRLVITDDEREAQRRFFERIDRPVCTVVVGTSKPEKTWAPERYARTLEIIERDYGFQTLLVGGPAPLERAAAAAIERATRAEPRNELGDDLRRLLWLLDGSAVVISPDTGPLHIARALDVPVVGLYGYTNPKRTGPYRKYTDLIVDGYARAPDEPYPVSMEYRPEGMSRVTVEAVVETFDRAVREHLRPGSRRAR